MSSSTPLSIPRAFQRPVTRIFSPTRWNLSGSTWKNSQLTRISSRNQAMTSSRPRYALPSMAAPNGTATTSGWSSSSMPSRSTRLVAAQERRTTSKSSSGMGTGTLGLSREPVPGLGVRLLGEGQHLLRLDAEHGGGILARAEHAVTHVEVPPAAVLRLIGVGKSLQAVTVDHLDRGPLDDDVEAASPAVVAGRQRHLLAVLEIAGLLLAEPGTEMHRSVLEDADQRGHVGPTVGPHRREPVQLRAFEHVLCVRPRRRAGVGLAEPAIELRGRIGLHGLLQRLVEHEELARCRKLRRRVRRHLLERRRAHDPTPEPGVPRPQPVLLRVDPASRHEQLE